MGPTHDTDEQLRVQRAALADIGACALRTTDMQTLLDEACRLVADGLGTKLCKVLRHISAPEGLLVCAGVGWAAGVVGHAVLDAGVESPAGYALLTGAPVISNDLAGETRFRTPDLLRQHGVRSAVNVIVRGDGKPFGVLEVDSRQDREFSADDIAFLQGAANLLGVALERGRRQDELREALAARDLLMREADHRIKNSLQLTASLLTLQRGRLSDPEAAAALDDAIARVQAVAATHRALHESADLRSVAFGRMLIDLCQHVGQLSPAVNLKPRVEGDLVLDAERAIPLGLIVSELLTNAVRHAYPEGGGTVEVGAAIDGADIAITVLDEGAGFEPASDATPSLGSTIVRALSRQIGAALAVESAPRQGTRVTLRLPRNEPGSDQPAPVSPAPV